MRRATNHCRRCQFLREAVSQVTGLHGGHIDVKWRVILGDVLPDLRDVVELGLSESRRIAVDVVGGGRDVVEAAPQWGEVACEIQVDGSHSTGQAAQLRNSA